MAEQEQVALITGATEPIAQSIARELTRRNWTVLLQGDDEGELQAAVEHVAVLAGRDGQVASQRADLTAAAEREQLVEFVLEEYGRIDLLANVPAGPAAYQGLLELGEEAYLEVMDAYVTASLFLMQLVANEMVRLVEAGQIEAPKIVLVNSIGAYTTSTDRAAHCLARAAMAMLTRLFADRLSEHGINVYEVRSGLISAGGGDDVHARYDQLIADGLTPIRRWGRPQDVALAVVTIAEDLLPYSTGEVINVDGGFHLRRL